MELRQDYTYYGAGQGGGCWSKAQAPESLSCRLHLGNKTGLAGGSEDGQEGGGVSTLRSGALQVEWVEQGMLRMTDFKS